jgi:uncharacterized surface protein with fasciclin (FAS1) repeats
MRKFTILAASAAAVLAVSSPSFAGATKPANTIVATASASPDFQTLVAAVKAAGLADTLASKGPFTVFAPTDAAFAKLPAGTVDNLLQPANLDTLKAVLTYHVVAGKVSAKDLVKKINAGGGSAKLTTVQGGTLTARLDGGKVVIVDAKGGTATVTTADLMQSNGIIHVTDAVSIPG